MHNDETMIASLRECSNESDIHAALVNYATCNNENSVAFSLNYSRFDLFLCDEGDDYGYIDGDDWELDEFLSAVLSSVRVTK